MDRRVRLGRGDYLPLPSPTNKKHPAKTSRKERNRRWERHESNAETRNLASDVPCATVGNLQAICGANINKRRQGDGVESTAEVYAARK